MLNSYVQFSSHGLVIPILLCFYQGPRIICPAFVIITQDTKLLTVPLAIPAVPPTYGTPAVTATARGGK